MVPGPNSRAAHGQCAQNNTAFVLSGPWPGGRDQPVHYLDEGIAQFLMLVVGSGSLLDIGAGVGRYGVYFDAERTLGKPVPRWTGVDGSENVEEYTRARGPPGSLTTHLNICEPGGAVRAHLAPHEWVMSFEVGDIAGRVLCDPLREPLRTVCEDPAPWGTWGMGSET